MTEQAKGSSSGSKHVIGSYPVIAAAGVAHVAFAIAATVIVGASPTTESDTVFVRHYSDLGTRHAIGLSFLLVVLAAAAFIAFLAGLRVVLARAEGEPHGLAVLAYTGGIVYVTLLAAADGVFTAATTALGTVTTTPHAHVDAQLVRTAGDIHWTLASLAGGGGAIMIVSSSLVAGRAGILGRFPSRVGVVMGVATLAFAMQEGATDRVGGGAPVLVTFSGVIVFVWMLVASWLIARLGRHDKPARPPD
jgi:hypothetical protein